jgi:hypothetical protein
LTETFAREQLRLPSAGSVDSFDFAARWLSLRNDLAPVGAAHALGGETFQIIPEQQCWLSGSRRPTLLKVAQTSRDATNVLAIVIRARMLSVA